MITFETEHINFCKYHSITQEVSLRKLRRFSFFLPAVVDISPLTQQQIKIETRVCSVLYPHMSVFLSSHSLHASYTCANNLTPKFKLSPYATLKNLSLFMAQSHEALSKVRCSLS